MVVLKFTWLKCKQAWLGDMGVSDYGKFYDKGNMPASIPGWSHPLPTI